jgi:16S rRNA (guanine527-N7)-methyltransferase
VKLRDVVYSPIVDEPYPLSTQMVLRLGGTKKMASAIRRYGDWLGSEAALAGGLGPEEPDRLDNRHLADSLAVAECWHPLRPSSIADLGSGVGLPGIPLAILYPDAAVTLVDRSEARCRLLKRAARVLGLPNLRVVQTDVNDLEGTFDVAVARGLAAPDRVLPALRRLVAPGGCGVVLGSRVAEVSVPGFSTREVGTGILEPVSWILMMDD